MDLEQFSFMPLGMGIKKDGGVACDVCGERRDCGMEAEL